MEQVLGVTIYNLWEFLSKVKVRNELYTHIQVPVINPVIHGVNAPCSWDEYPPYLSDILRKDVFILDNPMDVLFYIMKDIEIIPTIGTFNPVIFLFENSKHVLKKGGKVNSLVKINRNLYILGDIDDFVLYEKDYNYTLDCRRPDRNKIIHGHIDWSSINV